MQNVDLFRHKLAFIINSNHALFFAGIAGYAILLFRSKARA